MADRIRVSDMSGLLTDEDRAEIRKVMQDEASRLAPRETLSDLLARTTPKSPPEWPQRTKSMTNWKPDICIYHKDCLDGFTAAWAVWKRWGDDVQYIPAAYGDKVPEIAGLNVLMVDFSYKRPVIEQMSQVARSLVIIDHHKTAREDLEGFNKLGTERYPTGGTFEDVAPMLDRLQGEIFGNVLVQFDMSRSGAVMAWLFCNWSPGVPQMVLDVEDRDLWLFKRKHSAEINAYLGSLYFDFITWDRVAVEVLENVILPIEAGSALIRQQTKAIHQMIGASMRDMAIGGFIVPVANVPFMWASQAGHIMCEGRRFAATYFDRAEGTRQFSLRSDSNGIDVSEIAKAYGGGGHEHAAGFSAERGWEGDLEPLKTAIGDF